MDDRQKELLKDLADALERAGAAARALVEYEPEPVTLKVDGASVGQAVHRAIHGIRGESQA